MRPPVRARGSFGWLPAIWRADEHRVHDVDERLVRREEAVPTSEQVAFQPTLAGMLAEDLHHPTARPEMVVIWKRLSHPGAIGHVKNGLQPVGGHVCPAKQRGDCAPRRSAP